MRIYIIGASYPEFVRPGQSGAIMDFEEKGLATVIISDCNPSVETVEAFQKSQQFQLGLHYYRGQILLALQVGRLPWMDMIYQPHRAAVLSKEEFMRYHVEGALGINLHYVNSNTGELLAIKFVSSTLEFHKALIDAVKDKLSQPYDAVEDQKTLAEVYRELPDPLAVAQGVEVGFVLLDEENL